MLKQWMKLQWNKTLYHKFENRIIEYKSQNEQCTTYYMYISFHHIIKFCICSNKDCTCAHTFWWLWTSKLNNYSKEFSTLWSSSILNCSLVIYGAKFHVKISTDSGSIPYGLHLHTLIQVVRSHVLVQMQRLNNIWTSLAKQWANFRLVLQSMSTFMTTEMFQDLIWTSVTIAENV